MLECSNLEPVVAGVETRSRTGLPRAFCFSHAIERHVLQSSLDRLSQLAFHPANITQGCGPRTLHRRLESELKVHIAMALI